MNVDRALALRPALDAVVRAASARPAPLVLIDGPSGAGKSTFAAALVAEWPGRRPRLLRVDEAIPGWRGLRRGAEMLGPGLLRPRRSGRPGSLRSWDWIADRPGPVEHVAPGGPLILEGCGAFLAGAGRTGAVRVWLDAPVATRRERALARDRGAFDPYWDGWESDWRRYLGQSGAARRRAIRVRLAG
ncbi:ATP-binding protein [Agromyces sp. SYSU T0242]|uniref:ATP-binding protein n=1 Tax=Agromyces litoreus TaxID=3158561 RepID=UPI00339B577D